jgi:predicted RNA-binding Zn ribbon-like protein
MPPEPVAIAFANTRSSRHRDRIETLIQWRAWVEAWPGLRPAGYAVDPDGLLALRGTRDDLQLLLRGAAGGHRPEPTAQLAELTRSTPGLELCWRAAHLTLAVPEGSTAATVIAHHLARAAIDLLLTGPSFAACQEQDCRKLFVASRPDRRWCDSAVCGNRARVRAHSHRNRHTDPSASGPPNQGEQRA